MMRRAGVFATFGSVAGRKAAVILPNGCGFSACSRKWTEGGRRLRFDAPARKHVNGGTEGVQCRNTRRDEPPCIADDAFFSLGIARIFDARVQGGASGT